MTEPTPSLIERLMTPSKYRPEGYYGDWRLYDGAFEHIPTGYYVELDQCRTCAQLLDWIFQLHAKRWLDDKGMRDFLRIADDHLSPQASMCSCGEDMTRDRAA